MSLWIVVKSHDSLSPPVSYLTHEVPLLPLLPVASIRRITDPLHPLFDARVQQPADYSLVDSIRRDGFTTVLLVRRTDAGYDLIDGRRRHAACLAINPDMKVPCKIVEADDETAFNLMVAANETSKPYTDLQRAELIQRALDRGRSMAGVAAAFGITPAMGYKLLQLLQVAQEPNVREAIEDGRVSVSAAVALASVPEEVRREAAGKGVTAREAEELRREWRGKEGVMATPTVAPASGASPASSVPSASPVPVASPVSDVSHVASPAAISEASSDVMADASPASLPPIKPPPPPPPTVDTANPERRCHVLDQVTAWHRKECRSRPDTLWSLLAWAADGDGGNLDIDESGVARQLAEKYVST